MYYRVNQEPNKYDAKFNIEYLEDMSHFFGLLNNNKIRKSFFEDAEYFSKISSDEYVVKEYIRNNMEVKRIYYQGTFIYILYDDNEKLVHVFSHEPFLTEEEEISRVFKLNIIKTTYSSLIKALLTDCLNERAQFYKKYSDAVHHFHKINELKENALHKKEKFVDEDPQKTEEYGKAIRCHMARVKQNNEAKLECFPVLKEIVKTKDFFNLTSSLVNTRASFFDLIYSEKQRELAQFLNTFAGY